MIICTFIGILKKIKIKVLFALYYCHAGNHHFAFEGGYLQVSVLHCQNLLCKYILNIMAHQYCSGEIMKNIEFCIFLASNVEQL